MHDLHGVKLTRSREIVLLRVLCIRFTNHILGVFKTLMPDVDRNMAMSGTGFRPLFPYGFKSGAIAKHTQDSHIAQWNGRSTHFDDAILEMR